MTARRTALAIGRPILVIVGAFVLAGIVYEVNGFSAAAAFRGVWDGAVAAPGATSQTLRWTIPLLLVALGVVISFRAGFFNVGGQGQMYVGAIVGLVVGRQLGGLPSALAIPLVIVAGSAGGAVWSMVPGLLRARFKADEVVTTLMMNFIAVQLLAWVATGPLKDTAGSAEASRTKPVPDGLRLSDGTGVSLKLVVIAVLAVVFVAVLLSRTRFGLRATLAGRNPEMARWQGVDGNRLTIQSFALAGALAGLAGAVELLGPAGRLGAGFSPDVGFVAVIIALVAGLRVSGAVIAALFFGGLHAAILYLPIATDLPSSALDLLNGFVALFITVSAVPVLLHRRRRRVGAASPAGAAAAAAAEPRVNVGVDA
jgi:simple sugar transport system permease protein